MVSEQLRDIPGRELPSDGALLSVDAYLAADPEQTENSGLRATFTLANHGDGPIELQNSFETLQWQLLDEPGAPLPLPRRPPNLLVIGEPPESWTAENPLQIVEARYEGETVEITALDAPSLELPPGAHWAATFEIDRLDTNGDPPLEAGTYAIASVATLIDVVDPKLSRILRSAPIQVRFSPSDRGP
jgi:hypothetical protein